MVSKVIVTLCVVVAVAAAVPAGGWGPPGGWGPAAGGWRPAAGGWGPAAGGWGPAAAGGVNPWIPPWVAAAPWFPKWTSCSTVGDTCQDCSTKLICTPIGGLQIGCTDPTLPYCNAGTCSAVPTTECAPVQAVPATSA